MKTHDKFRDADLVEVSQLAVGFVHRCDAINSKRSAFLHQLDCMFMCDVDSFSELTTSFFSLSISKKFSRSFLG